MSLDWKNTKNQTPEWAALVESGVATTIILSTMIVDLGEVTEKNLNEWRVRLGMHAAVWGGLINEFDENEQVVRRMPTVEELRAAIGLCTNVITTSRAAYRKKMMERIEREAVMLVVQEDEKRSVA